MGTERILSKLNSSDVFTSSPASITKAGKSVDYTSKVNAMRTAMMQRYDSLGVIYIQPENGGEGLVTPESGRIKQPTPAYYYHSDHLGSSSLLSDNDGNVSQHIEYLPFGEVFVEERNNNWNTPYKFNAKELDEETGLYYYGARYFDSRTSVWYGVDPLGEKKPWLTPYHYCSNNPINKIDPDGRIDMDNKTQQQYPAITKYIKQLSEDWKYKTQEFKNNFMEKSGLNEKQVKAALTFGEGPKLEVEDLSKREAGGVTVAFEKSKGKLENANEGKGLIKLDVKIVKMLENAKSEEEQQAANLMVESTTFHEMTHYGNVKTSMNFNGKFYESGKAFENSVYGRDINPGSVLKFVKVMNAPIKARAIPFVKLK